MNEKHQFTFVGTCVGADSDEIEEFDEGAEDVNFKEFLKAVGQETVNKLPRSKLRGFSRESRQKPNRHAERTI